MQPYRFSKFDEKDLRFKTYKNILREYRDNAFKKLNNETHREAIALSN